MALYEEVLERWLASVAPRVPREVALRFVHEENPNLGPMVEAAARDLRERKSASKFQRWLDQQALAGRDFDAVQLGWLDTMRRQITASGALSLAQLDGGDLAVRGGADKATRVFGGRQLGEVLASLNATFAPAKACGCGGNAGGVSVCGIQAGCSCKKAAPATEPTDPVAVLSAAGLTVTGLVYRLGELTVYRAPNAEALSRATRALEQANLFTRVWNEQLLIRPRQWISP